MPGIPRPILRRKPLGSHPSMVFAEDQLAARRDNPRPALASGSAPPAPPPPPAPRATAPRARRRAGSITEVPEDVSPTDVYGQVPPSLRPTLLQLPRDIPCPPTPPPKPSPPLSEQLPLHSAASSISTSSIPSLTLSPPPPPSPTAPLEACFVRRQAQLERDAALEATFGPAEADGTGEARAIRRDAGTLVDALRAEVATHRTARAGSALVHAGETARGRRMASREALRQRWLADAERPPAARPEGARATEAAAEPRLRRALGALVRRASTRTSTGAEAEDVEGLERTLEDAEALLADVRAWLETLEEKERR